jgi:peptidyl-prolyl cis-trans isomerase C
MKILTIAFLFSALSYGQAAAQIQPPVNVTPGAAAATPAQPVAPETVVAEVNGKKYTAAEVDKLITTLPAQYQQAARMQPQLLSQVFLMQRLAEDAEKAGLDQKAPLKEQLEISRLQMLSTAQLTDVNNTMKVTEEDEEKYYKDNPDKFKQVKVRAIYIAFNPASAKPAEDGKKMVTEAEAKSKIESVAKQVQGGADFGKLAHDLSDDKASAAKDGDFGVIKQDSPYPPEITTAVFALKQGEVSAPIRQPNGFYLLRAEEVAESSLNESLAQVSQLARQAKFKEWMDGMKAQYRVKIENPAYFSPRVSAPVQPVH